MKRKQWIRLLTVAVMGGSVAGYGFVHNTWKEVTDPVGGSDPIRVTIEPGSAGRQIGYTLETAGAIRSAQAWELWTRTFGRDWLFQAGTYDLDPNRDMLDIAQQLRRGETVRETLTIPEGWRIDQMATALAEQGWFEVEVFQEQLNPDRYSDLAWLPPDLVSLEGYLFPDTYHLSLDQLQASEDPSQRADHVIRAMLQRFEQVALPLYQENQQGSNPTSLTLHEWVTLASLVEREAVVAEERALIAGVFTKRLEQGWTLGSDPTVEYAFNIRQTPDRRLTLAEVRTPSPYNTYINPGLPPGPIASPGLASLQAALDPEETEYFYFVARYDGTHIFSKTLEDHEAAQLQVIEDRNHQQQNSSSNP